jgi:hypothetical protein
LATPVTGRRRPLTVSAKLLPVSGARRKAIAGDASIAAATSASTASAEAPLCTCTSMSGASAWPSPVPWMKEPVSQ